MPSREQRLKKFNRQDPSVRRHGPKKRRVVYKEAIEKILLNEGNEWLTADEIAHKANNFISSYWTQLNTHSVAAILRIYERDKIIESKRKLATQPKQYRVIYTEKLIP